MSDTNLEYCDSPVFVAMCIGNRASSAAYYINKHLAAQWNISNECVKKHGHGLKSTRIEVEYGSCLSQICVGKHNRSKPSKEDLNFFASFGAPPMLEFICNHEVLLQLYIKTGHCRPEGKGSSKAFEGYTCAFRMQYREHLINDTSYGSLGQTDNCKAKLLILDLSTATFLREFSSVSDGLKLGPEETNHLHNSVSASLLTHYFPLMRKAGFHCIYSLPDFDDLSRTHSIDYTVFSDIEIEMSEIFGINVNTINNFLTSRWLEAVAGVDELEGDYNYSLSTKVALAEHRGVHEGIHFHASFGPPQIRPICPKEVLYIIDVQDLSFYLDGGFKRYISFSPNISSNRFVQRGDPQGLELEACFDLGNSLARRKSRQASQTRLSNARFSENRSVWSSETIEETRFVKLRNIFIQYITKRYLVGLEEFEHHTIDRLDLLAEDSEENYSDSDDIIEVTNEFGEVIRKSREITNDFGEVILGPKEFTSETRDLASESRELTSEYRELTKEFRELTREFREHLSITETFGFDIITTVTQGSINDHFRTLWKASQTSESYLFRWTFEEFFGASFGPLQIQFPSDSTSNVVIVYVNLLKGFLTALGLSKNLTGGEKHNFSDWKLAFEVPLRLRDYTKAHAISEARLRDREKISVGEYDLKQLVLDFNAAKTRQDLTRLSGLSEAGNYRVMRSRREALVHYISKFYLPQLKQEGHHVLCSVPIWKRPRSSDLIRYAPSSFAFQFFPAPSGQGDRPVSTLSNNRPVIVNRTMLVICGMIDNTHRPAFPLPPYPWRWSPSQEKFSGMIALSRSIFLEGWLLRELARVNSRTTLVPVFHGIGDFGAWNIELVSWGEHSFNKDRPCTWKPIKGLEGGLNYEWSNSDEWTYAHQGDVSDIHNGGYSVACETLNSLMVPTVNHHGVCEVKITGRIDLKLAFSGSKRNWSTTATARWSATISLSSDPQGRGLRITSTSSKDVSDFSGFSGNFEIVHPKFKDSSNILRHQLSEVVIIEQETIHELESSFSGVWPLFYSGAYGYTLSNPVFNAGGDLLLELASPLDGRGRVIVSEESRLDIHVPSKTHMFTRHSKESSFVESETSTFASTTVLDSPFRVPQGDDTF